MNLLVPTISAVSGTVSSGAQVYYIKRNY
jgi:hypothetical protein